MRAVMYCRWRKYLQRVDVCWAIDHRVVRLSDVLCGAPRQLWRDSGDLGLCGGWTFATAVCCGHVANGSVRRGVPAGHGHRGRDVHIDGEHVHGKLVGQFAGMDLHDGPPFSAALCDEHGSN